MRKVSSDILAAIDNQNVTLLLMLAFDTVRP